MTITRFNTCALVCLLLAGCGTNGDDPSAYVAQIKARAPQPIEPMPTIASYQPYIYAPEARRAPFTPTRRAAAPERPGNSLRPDPKRKPDPLERFPLDALRMVGTITSSGVTYALIAAPDRIIHRARRGDHLGQNYGEIESVSDKGIAITEIVPDGTDGYSKRGAALAPSG